MLLTGLTRQERKNCDAVAEPGRGVPHVRLRLLERLDDLFRGGQRGAVRRVSSRFWLCLIAWQLAAAIIVSSAIAGTGQG